MWPAPVKLSRSRLIPPALTDQGAVIVGNLEHRENDALPRRKRTNGPVFFSLGLGVGAVGGLVVGVLIGKQILHLAGMLIGLIERRSSDDDERLKFELLLQ